MWNSHSVSELMAEFSGIISNDKSQFFLKYETDIPIGFAQCQLRYDYVEGTELSRRTFINNLHAIEELFEINIECGSGFRYHIEYGDCFEEGSARNWLLNAS